ncbi:MAG: 30S ribosomal protein S9 [Candidatus Paceibacterota bacterium]
MKEDKNEQKYIEAIGRRKTSVARVRLFEDKKTSFTVNERSLEEYFPREELQQLVKKVFTESGVNKDFYVSAKIYGGGSNGQTEALCHGIARVLTEIEPDCRHHLKKAGFLKRDPRHKERKKFGLKKARKSPQWSKR